MVGSLRFDNVVDPKQFSQLAKTKFGQPQEQAITPPYTQNQVWGYGQEEASAGPLLTSTPGAAGAPALADSVHDAFPVSRGGLSMLLVAHLVHEKQDMATIIDGDADTSGSEH